MCWLLVLLATKRDRECRLGRLGRLRQMSIILIIIIIQLSLVLLRHLLMEVLSLGKLL